MDSGKRRSIIGFSGWVGSMLDETLLRAGDSNERRRIDIARMTGGYVGGLDASDVYCIFARNIEDIEGKIKWTREYIFYRIYLAPTSPFYLDKFNNPDLLDGLKGLKALCKEAEETYRAYNVEEAFTRMKTDCDIDESLVPKFLDLVPEVLRVIAQLEERIPRLSDENARELVVAGFSMLNYSFIREGIRWVV